MFLSSVEAGRNLGTCGNEPIYLQKSGENKKQKLVKQVDIQMNKKITKFEVVPVQTKMLR